MAKILAKDIFPHYFFFFTLQMATSKRNVHNADYTQAKFMVGGSRLTINIARV